MADRKGWPDGTVERAECANCGVYGYSVEPAPPRGSFEYETWLRRVWPDGRAQVTRLGFFVWHSLRCEWGWKKPRVAQLHKSLSGYAHSHLVEMDRRRIKSGAG